MCVKLIHIIRTSKYVEFHKVSMETYFCPLHASKIMSTFNLIISICDLVTSKCKIIMGFSKYINIGHIDALSKFEFFFFLHGSLYFSCFLFENESISPNVLSMILLIVHSFVRFLKYYCQNNIGLHHANQNDFCIDSFSNFSRQFFSTTSG